MTKILVFQSYESGHLTPILTILKELNRAIILEIIVYAPLEYRESIESTGSQFKSLIDNFIEWKNVSKASSHKGFDITDFYDAISRIALKNTIYLAKEIDNEQPDLIIYDHASAYALWAFKYYERCFDLTSKNNKSEFSPKQPLPPILMISTTFALKNGLYPNEFEKKFFNMTKFNLSFLFKFLKLVWFQIRLCYRFDIKLKSIMNSIIEPNFVKYVIVTVLPELQPRSHLFDQNVYKFVGTTIDDTLIDTRIDDYPFRNLLAKFPLRINDHQFLSNTQDNFNLTGDSNTKLIFASMGTIFNHDFMIYKLIVDAFKEFDQDESPKEKRNDSLLKFYNLRVVISTGEKIYDMFNHYIQSNKYEIPKNITLVKSAPQNEILKRASLFITHCGMNSTSESVHFGVPMICLPISGDQKLVAYRVADELGLGIRLDVNNLKCAELRRAIHKILNDKSYEIRVKRLSELSRKCNGYQNAARIVLDLLDNE